MNSAGCDFRLGGHGDRSRQPGSGGRGAGRLFALVLANFGASKAAPVALVTLVAFVMIGPYSYLSGAISLDFGGKQVRWGWKGAFASVAAVALLSGLAAGV